MTLNYSEAIEKIDSLLVFGSKPGLDRIKKLLSYMGDPQDALKFVHVAGTNGKGSVCNMLSGVLAAAGYKTGLFTSPHITGFGERMQINGVQISESDISSLVERLFPIVEKMRSDGEIITEFEFVAAMGFQYFKDNRCDIVVLETGMGGRFDATNVIKSAVCSVITSISFDHTAVLGHTLEKITFEKCGIIKDGCAAVYLPQEREVSECIESAAREHESRLYEACVPNVSEMSLDGTLFEYEGLTVRLPLIGRHQLKNLALVLAAVQAFRDSGFDVSAESGKRGIEGVVLPARFEKLCSKPLVIADGAHNPDGLHALSVAIDDHLGGRHVICVLGMLKDKDCITSAKWLCGRADELIVTTVPDNPRRQTALELKESLSGLFSDIDAFESPKEALTEAVTRAKRYGDNAAVVLCGSLYLISRLREYNDIIE